ncbi:phosphotransferase [Paraglaciecola aestuariivivens]
MDNLVVNLKQELASLAFVEPKFKLTQFNGGTINSSYCLETAGKKYFVKTFESDQMTQLDRQVLYDIQLKLAAKKLSVKPIYLSVINHFQIDEWFEESTLDQVNLSDQQIAKVLASTLANIHGITLDAPKLDLPQQWVFYQQQLGIKLNQAQITQQQQMADIWYSACDKLSLFCHNDLALSHISHTFPAKIFDWEYCSLSSPYFDLASCIKVNGLNATDQASLCAYYARFTEQPLTTVVAQVKLMQPLVDYTYSLWYRSANLGG